VIKNIVSAFLKRYYDYKVEIAKGRFKNISLDDAKTQLDFNSLDILPEIDDCTIYLDPNDEGLSADLYAWGLREPINTYVLCNFIRKERNNLDAIIDVGSNIGYFPLVELASGAKYVIAIEPVPETYMFLKKNLNRFKNCITLNVALSDKTQKIKMYVLTKLNLATADEKAALDNVRYHKVPIKEVVEVEGFTLKDIITSQKMINHNVLVRMDVEGFEEKILKNLPEEIYSVSLELHNSALGYERSVALLRRLERAGHKVEVIVRELRKAVPLVKYLGINKVLKLYEKTNNPRIFLNPSKELIRDLLKKEAYLHMFTIKR